MKCPVRWLNAMGSKLAVFKSPTFLVVSSASGIAVGGFELV